MNWLVIVVSCVSIMTSFVYQRPAVRLMYRVQRPNNRVIAATTECETVL